MNEQKKQKTDKKKIYELSDENYEKLKQWLLSDESEQEIKKFNYLYLQPISDKTITLDNGKVFLYFNVLDEQYNLVDCYDFIKLEGNLRFDVERSEHGELMRIYPSPLGHGVCYDFEQHKIIGEK